MGNNQPCAVCDVLLVVAIAAHCKRAYRLPFLSPVFFLALFPCSLLQVSEILAILESSKGYEAANTKLVCAGKILKPDLSLTQQDFKEGSFIVVMYKGAPKVRLRGGDDRRTQDRARLAADGTEDRWVRRLLTTSARLTRCPPAVHPLISSPLSPLQTVAPAASAAAPAPAAAAASAPAPAPAAAASASAPAPAAAFSTPARPVAPPAPPAPVAASPADANPFAGPEFEGNVSALVGMGFEEPLVRRALQAAFNNADRAADFLMSGNIPAVPVARAAAPAAPGAVSQRAAGAPAPAAGGALAILRQHPQFNQLKQLVQANPAVLPEIIAQIGASSPELLEAIQANREEFVAMMNEPIAEGTDDEEMEGEDDGERKRGEGGGREGWEGERARSSCFSSALSSVS